MRIKKNLWKVLNQKIIGAGSLRQVKQVITGYTAGIKHLHTKKKYFKQSIFSDEEEWCWDLNFRDSAQLLSKLGVSPTCHHSSFQPDNRVYCSISISFLTIFSRKFSPREGGSSLTMISPDHQQIILYWYIIPAICPWSDYIIISDLRIRISPSKTRLRGTMMQQISGIRMNDFIARDNSVDVVWVCCRSQMIYTLRRKIWRVV